MKILLKNGTVWQPGGGCPADVLVEEEKIVRLAPDIPTEGVDQVIDLTGKTVFPGFFNAHVHLYGVHGPLPDELIQKFVTGGVTTVRDMGMTAPGPYEDYQQWRARRTGPEYPAILSAGKFICGPNTYGAVHPSGAKIGYVIEETPEAAAAAVDAMVDAGAQLIKTGLDYGMDANNPLDYLPEEVFRAICQRARERGVPSSAHITKAGCFVKAARWGLTECAHTSTDHLSDEDIREIAASGIAFDATMSIFDMVSAQTGERIMDNVISNTGRLYRAGVPMSVGTDFMSEHPPYQTPGIPLHELRLLSKAGLSVDEIIQAATLDSARLCGVADVCGSMEEGKLANLIAVSGPVDETFRAFEHLPFVMNRGTVVVRT